MSQSSLSTVVLSSLVIVALASLVLAPLGAMAQPAGGTSTALGNSTTAGERFGLTAMAVDAASGEITGAPSSDIAAPFYVPAVFLRLLRADADEREMRQGAALAEQVRLLRADADEREMRQGAALAEQARLLRADADDQKKLVRADLAEQVRLLRADADEREMRQGAALAEQVRLLRADADEREARLTASLHGMNASLTSLHADVAALLQVSPTVRAFEGLAACATASTWFIAAPVNCSAFFYASAGIRTAAGAGTGPNPGAGASAGTPPIVAVVTAAHCFDKLPGLELLELKSTSGGSFVCSIMAIFKSPNDLAVLSCPGAPIDAPSLLVSTGSQLGLSVAAVGFVDSPFANTPRFSLPAFPSISLKLTVAHLSNVAGYYNNVTCDTLQASPSSVVWPVEPTGFIDGLITRGMSGGPLLDLRCGVVGVLHGKGCESSIYMGLDAVDKFLWNQATAPATAAGTPGAQRE